MTWDTQKDMLNNVIGGLIGLVAHWALFRKKDDSHRKHYNSRDGCFLMKSFQPLIPEKLFDILSKDITELRPAQRKAVDAGLVEGKSVLVCTPTASGKTLIGELAALTAIFEKRRKAVYIVPLKALASEKYNHLKKRYGHEIKVALSSGDLDKADSYLEGYDFIIVTSEKLDSLLRHHAPWLAQLETVIIDEIHLLNDPSRGPTLEIIITLLRSLIPNLQIVGLSATIGNQEELAEWLGAELVTDNWRPVQLKKGIYYDGRVEFY